MTKIRLASVLALVLGMLGSSEAVLSQSVAWKPMPHFEGLSVKDAKTRISDLAINAKYVFLNESFEAPSSVDDAAIVSWQYPDAGRPVENGETIALVFGYSPKKSQIGKSNSKLVVNSDWRLRDPSYFGKNSLPKLKCRSIFGMDVPKVIDPGKYLIVAQFPPAYEPIDPSSVVGAIVVPLETFDSNLFDQIISFLGGPRILSIAAGGVALVSFALSLASLRMARRNSLRTPPTI